MTSSDALTLRETHTLAREIACDSSEDMEIRLDALRIMDRVFDFHTLSFYREPTVSRLEATVGAHGFNLEAIR